MPQNRVESTSIAHGNMTSKGQQIQLNKNYLPTAIIHLFIFVFTHNPFFIMLNIYYIFKYFLFFISISRYTLIIYS